MITAATYTITLGLESPAYSEQECRRIALQLAGQCFPAGHTITEATGRWESPERGLIDEPSLVVTVIGEGSAHRDAVKAFCQAYKEEAQQDAVLLQITHPETFWI